MLGNINKKDNASATSRSQPESDRLDQSMEYSNELHSNRQYMPQKQNVFEIRIDQHNDNDHTRKNGYPMEQDRVNWKQSKRNDFLELPDHFESNGTQNNDNHNHSKDDFQTTNNHRRNVPKKQNGSQEHARDNPFSFKGSDQHKNHFGHNSYDDNMTRHHDDPDDMLYDDNG